MVVFTCGHCGESVQKPKVEKHYMTKCRNRSPNLSCMDCFKDFLGNDYEAHIKCITEEQRYSGKGYVAKEKKGEKKQNTWVEMLQSVLDEQKNISGNVRRIIETVIKQTNTPRKKPKFINFVKNCCGQKTNPSDIEKVWDLISVKLSELSNHQNKDKKSNDNTNDKTKSDESVENGVINNNESQDEVTLKNDELNDTNKSQEEENLNNDDNNESQEETLKNDKVEKTNGEVNGVEGKKLSKKQRKEEKKRQKYEAELQSAVVPPAEEEEEVQTKRGKKKKNRTESLNNGEVEDNLEVDSKGKKKRKRQDTVASLGVPEIVDNANENIENEPVIKEKTQKKKLKVGEPKTAADESICLHDQNVAKNEEEPIKSGKFDWHAVILSVLSKKDNEVPFKRLQKKVLAEYSELTGQDVDDRIADKFIKKLKSAPNVRVDKNRVYILE